MKIGEFTKQIVIQNRTVAPDSHGDHTGSWANLATVRAAFRPLPLREKWSDTAQRKISIEAGRFYTWQDSTFYADDGSDDWTKIRIQYRGKNWDVLSISPLEDSHQILIEAEVQS